MSVFCESVINFDELYLQSQKLLGRSNSLKRSKKLLAALIKWVSPNIRSSYVADFIEWYYSGNTEIKSYYQSKMERKLQIFLPILTKNFGDVTFADENDQTILHYCLLHMKYSTRVNDFNKRNDRILISILCKWGASIIANNCDGDSPLGIALTKNRMDLVKNMIKYGCTDVKDSNNLGQTLLHILIDKYRYRKKDYRKYMKVIGNLLYLKNADLDQPDNDGITAVHLAAKNLDIELLNMFRRSGARLNSLTNAGDNLLIIVCKNIFETNNQTVIVPFIDWLINWDLNVNSKNKKNLTPLHYASQSNELAAIVNLEKANADLHAIAMDGTNSLHSAVTSSNFTIMIYLITYNNVNTHLRDNVYGFTLIHMAAFSYEEMNMNYLIQNGFDPNDQGKSGLTPLHLAALVGNAKVIKTLILFGANVQSKDRYCCYTALHLASMRGKLTTLQNIVGLHAVIANGDSSLVSYCFEKLRLQEFSGADYKGTIVELLKAGADVNARDNCNRTPLHYATLQSTCNYYHNYVEILLNAGAYVDVHDTNGQTPLKNSLLNSSNMNLRDLLGYGANIDDIGYLDDKTFKRDLHKNSPEAYVMRHLVKLDTANLYVSDRYRRHFKDYRLEEFYRKYSSELKKLKKRMIAFDLSLYDLLHANFKRQAEFSNWLPYDLDTTFPHYYLILKGKCKEAVNRKPLIEPAKIAYQQLSGLPDLCVDIIISFLSNGTLRAVIDSVEEYE